MAAAFLDAAKSDSRVPGISTSQHEGHGQDAALIAFDGGDEVRSALRPEWLIRNLPFPKGN